MNKIKLAILFKVILIQQDFLSVCALSHNQKKDRDNVCILCFTIPAGIELASDQSIINDYFLLTPSN